MTPAEGVEDIRHGHAAACFHALQGGAEFVALVRSDADEFSEALGVLLLEERAQLVVRERGDVLVQLQVGELLVCFQLLDPLLGRWRQGFLSDAGIFPRLLTSRKGTLQMKYPLPSGFGLQ